MEEENAKDVSFMPKNLQDWLNQGDYAKALKFCQTKMTKGQKSSMFFAVMTAYCLLKGEKQAECLEILKDYRAMKPTDSTTTKYMVAIYNNVGNYAEATILLEYIINVFPSKKELQEQLFFSYVREGKLLKQQNQALNLYKNH